MNNSAIGPSWDEIRNQLYTPEEIAASDLRVGIICELIDARQEKGISQKKLEKLSGVKQPVIARMELGDSNPRLETVLKVLAALGKTLVIAPLKTRSSKESNIKVSLAADEEYINYNSKIKKGVKVSETTKTSYGQ